MTRNIQCPKCRCIFEVELKDFNNRFVCVDCKKEESKCK